MQSHFFLFTVILLKDCDQSFFSHLLCDTCNFMLSFYCVPSAQKGPSLFCLFFFLIRETIPSLNHLCQPLPYFHLSFAFSCIIYVVSGSARFWLETGQSFPSHQLTFCSASIQFCLKLLSHLCLHPAVQEALPNPALTCCARNCLTVFSDSPKDLQPISIPICCKLLSSLWPHPADGHSSSCRCPGCSSSHLIPVYHIQSPPSSAYARSLKHLQTRLAMHDLSSHLL